LLEAYLDNKAILLKEKIANLKLGKIFIKEQLNIKYLEINKMFPVKLFRNKILMYYKYAN
jgi:hypothetical protein